MHQTAAPLLKRLALPIYLPSALSAAGGTALLPMLPLIAVSLGFSTATAALILSIIGMMAIIGPIPLGVMMERTGERPAMLLAAAVSIASSLLGIWLVTQGPSLSSRVWLLSLLVIDGIAAEVWDLGRQTYLGAELPIHLRGRAMNFFGGMMRIGGVIGPTLGAGAYALAGFAGSYALRAVLMLVAGVMVVCFLTPSTGRAPAPIAPPTPGRTGLYPHVVKAITVVGLGLLGLIVARINASVLLPLVGAHLGLDPQSISLIFALGMALEIALFLPAGILLDRWGRAVMSGLCCLGLGLGFVLLSLAGRLGPALAGYIVARLVISMGNALGSGIIKTLSVDLTPGYRRSAHMGYYNSITGAGVLAGPLLVGAVTATAGVLAAAAATGGAALVGGAWLWAVLPRYAPGWHGRAPSYQPDTYQPDTYQPDTYQPDTYRLGPDHQPGSDRE